MEFTTFLLWKMGILVIVALIYGIIVGLRGSRPRLPER